MTLIRMNWKTWNEIICTSLCLSLNFRHSYKSQLSPGNSLVNIQTASSIKIECLVKWLVAKTRTSLSWKTADFWKKDKRQHWSSYNQPWLKGPYNSMPSLKASNKLSSAEFLVCFTFWSASMLLKVGENVLWVSNSLDPDETLSNSASHPDPSCSHMDLSCAWRTKD